MKVLIASDSFKGCLSSLEAGNAMAEGVRRFDPTAEIIVRPLADGGEGTAAAIASSSPDWQKIEVPTLDPLGREISASFFFNNTTKTAVIDSAAASGITLLNPDETDAKRTSTFGTGLLLDHARALGAKHILLGLGGSATVDLGIGALQALGVKFFDEIGNFLSFRLAGGDLSRIHNFDIPRDVKARWEEIDLTLLCDVETKLADCAKIFGPQKGLNPDETEKFSQELMRVGTLLTVSYHHVNSTKGIIPPTADGSGAAGGLGTGLSILIPAKSASGARFVINTVISPSDIAGCDFILTGEGKSDRQTLLHKAPYELLLASSARSSKKIPVLLFAGKIEDSADLLSAGFSAVTDINSAHHPASSNDHKTPMKSGDFASSSLLNPLDPLVARPRLSSTVYSIFKNYLK